MSEKITPSPPSETTEDLTRRQWLWRLGEMVALAGVSGFVPEAAALLQSPEAAGHGVASLPPGLYGPSQEHLVHAMASSGKHFAAAPGSPTDYVRPHPGPYQPQFFSPEEFRVITRFVETMLGDVDPQALAETAQWLDLYLHSAPGVREAARHLDPLHRILAVEFYGENVVRELETADPQAAASAGLKALHDLSVQQHGKPFLALTKTEQVRLVASSGAADPESPARKFFTLMRGETMRGYYTSARGLADLDYQGNAYYSDCPGCKSES